MSHVYANPVQDAATYAHVAGRCGRVGQSARGVVTTIGSGVDRDALARLLPTVALEEALAPPSIADEVLEDSLLDDASSADGDRAFLESVVALEAAEGGGEDT